MKAESRASWERLRRGQGFWLGILLLGLGILLQGVRPLWHSALAQREQVLLLERRVKRLQQFAAHWNGDVVQEEKRQLAENDRKLESPRSWEAWLEELERTAEQCQVQCLQLAPVTGKARKQEEKEYLEVTLEGNYFQLLTFFRQWEKRHPGCWTEDGTLEANGTGQKIHYNGKFHLVIKKSSKSR